METTELLTSNAGWYVMAFGLLAGAMFLGRRRIAAALKGRRWLEALAVVAAYAAIIAGPFAVAIWLAPNPKRAPIVVIELLIVGACIDGVIRRLRNPGGG